MTATELVLRNPQPDTMLTVIERAVMSPDFDVNKLKELLELRERYEATEARKAFVSAMNLFKRNPPRILKNKQVAFKDVRYSYAALDQVCSAVTEGLSAVGISHRWEVDQKEAVISVTCVLTHEQGHSERTTLLGNPDNTGSKNSIQAIGSTVSYLQRYTLLAATGLAATADDDGKGITNGELAERVEWLHNACTVAELKSMFEDAYKAFKGDGNAQRALIAAKDQRKKVLEGM